jgi:hypothetical protein
MEDYQSTAPAPSTASSKRNKYRVEPFFYIYIFISNTAYINCILNYRHPSAEEMMAKAAKKTVENVRRFGREEPLKAHRDQKRRDQKKGRQRRADEWVKILVCPRRPKQ